ncbi:MAG: phosphotransferase [Clostridia bacterium]|nr:phosphotransferase [Clostridia bacterium]
MLNQLFEQLNLGMIQESFEVKGGLLHQMYGVKTAHEAYAVKQLNDRMMNKPNILDHYEDSEAFATYACENLKGIAALSFNQFVQQTEEGYFIIYPWFEGLTKTSFSEKEVRKVGIRLAELHHLNYKTQMVSITVEQMDWSQYPQLREKDLELLKSIEKDMKEITTLHLYSHRDMDPKNIMWLNEEPYIIDWESSGLIDPRLDLLEGALYFSYKDLDYDEALFLSYLEGYFSISDLQGIQAMLPYLFMSKLGWLEHLLLRGTEEEIKDMIHLIEITNRNIPNFRKWIKKSNKYKK